jgi:DNA (cytosine-5)-methyltransferase 1
MIGNAIPPTFTYLVALAAKNIAEEDFSGFEKAGSQLTLPERKALVTASDKEGRSYPETRSFRAAIPGLRFKSGMRFDLSNDAINGNFDWKVRFFFGSSKDIREVDLDGSVAHDLRRAPWIGPILAEMRGNLIKAENDLRLTDPNALQAVWTRRAEGISPYDVTDTLGELADTLHATLESAANVAVREYVAAYVIAVADNTVGAGRLPGQSKLEKYAFRIVSGFVIGDWFNTLTWHTRHQAAA